jgi:hypothetical protein
MEEPLHQELHPKRAEEEGPAPLDPELEQIEWGGSLLNMREMVLACLDCARPASVLEIGAYRGDLTELLAGWAGAAGAKLTSVEPAPQPELLRVAQRHPGLDLVVATSHDALRELPPAEAVILDGDHNYFTLSEELRLIAQGAPEGELPLMIFHDVGWPHGRRDSYYEPERIPPEGRQPMALDVGVLPGVEGTVEEGLQFTEWTALREGGPRNGVRTAIEDFLADRGGLRFSVVPAFFGVGVLYREDAPWAAGVAAVLEPLVGNPILERLEENRVAHLLKRQVHARRLVGDQIRKEEQERLLRMLLDSSAFAVGERLSRLRLPSGAMSWREQMEHALGEGDEGTGRDRD